MPVMKVSFIEPYIELKPYIQSIWIVESPVGMSPSENNLAAPNGSPKLIFNFENSIVSVVDGKLQQSKEHCLYFVGTRDSAALLRTASGKTYCIGIEFYPHGAYPIFGIPMVEMTNCLFPADTIFSGYTRELCDVLPDLRSAKRAINLIQNQLAAMLKKRRLQNPIVEYCVGNLKANNGLIGISDLERKTGYSRRYLEMLFKDHVGFSPKVLAGIFRFQKFYRKWALGLPYDKIKDELYSYYYDQAHFAKEFRKLTGFSPQYFTRHISNEFGRRLAAH
ncbi:MAG: helix-turn-helix transcriptional regulator [Bacteroidota bacterium]|nr:helix-turn-helix transcriptional regulator [Bacteroidota bacterium]